MLTVRRSRGRNPRVGIPFQIASLIFSGVVAVVAVTGVPPLLHAELPLESEGGFPDTVATLLKYGLEQHDIPSIQRWRDSHSSLVDSGADHTQADVALALIYARAGRHQDAWQLLASTRERDPDNLQVLRLLSWARLSDRQIIEGLQDASVLVARTQDESMTIDAVDVESILVFGGKAFGFGLAVVDLVQEHKADQTRNLRADVVAELGERAKVAFEKAEEEAREEVAKEIDQVQNLRATAIQEQQANNTQEQARLAAEQEALDAEGVQRKVQAAAVQQRAYEVLGRLQQQMAPLIQRRNILQSQLNQLNNRRGAEKQESDKKRYDPDIAMVQGEISGLNSELGGLESQFATVSQQASNALAALGGRYRYLELNYLANKRRMSENDGRVANGLTPKVAQDLRARTKLSRYMPLDFDVESKTVLRDGLGQIRGDVAR